MFCNVSTRSNRQIYVPCSHNTVEYRCARNARMADASFKDVPEIFEVSSIHIIVRHITYDELR